MQRQPKILVVYKFLDFPLRATINEHLYSFRRYSQAKVYYLMLDIGKELAYSKKPIPDYILGIDFDIILFHYGFISGRSGGSDPLWQNALEQIKPLKNSKAIKAVMPQDEYFHSNELATFVNEFGIDIVFSVSPESEWGKIYRGVDLNKVKFYKVLTGYLDDRAVDRINKELKKAVKDIDIGYRARNLPQWLGKHGYMKTQIADVFNERLKKFKLNTSISTRPEDTFFGYDWYRFMIRCKYMIGVEGGATVLDPDGSIHKKGSAYLKQHPNCTFDEIERACFPGLDGQLQLIAISPRHLEACATRTCQLLIESTFNGILQPGKHYIEIKSDLSNVDEVLQLVKEDSKRKEITDRAYNDIVKSGLYNYKTFVNSFIDQCLREAKGEYFEKNTAYNVIIHRYNHFQDWLAHRKYIWWKFTYRKLRNKWTYLMPLVIVAKSLGLKKVLKRFSPITN